MADKLYDWQGLKADLKDLFGSTKTLKKELYVLDHFGHQYDDVISQSMTSLMTYVDHGRELESENGEFEVYIMHIFKLIAESALMANRQSKELILANSNMPEMVSFLKHGAHETRLHYLKLYNQLYEVSGIRPHGHVIQVMLDNLFEYCEAKKNNKVRFTPNDDELIERFCELSVWSYDKLTAFRIFFAEYPQFLTDRVKQVAAKIAVHLKDNALLVKIVSDLFETQEK